MSLTKRLWIFIALLIILSPFGVIVPDLCNSGAAWGEWSGEEIEQMIGYLPQGFAKLSELWKSPMPDYGFHGKEAPGLLHLSLSYIVAAIVGVACVAGIVFFIGKLLAQKSDHVSKT